MSTPERTTHALNLEPATYRIRAADGVLVAKRRLARAATPAQTSSRQWAIDVLTPLNLMLCAALAVWGMTQLGQLIIAPSRVQVCDGFDYSAAHARCSAPDPFVVLGQGAGGTYLQIDVPGTIGRSGTPVTISVNEMNGSGLVTAEGKTSWVLHQSGTGIAVLPLQNVFAAARIPLTTALARHTGWEQDRFAVQVRAGTQDLGEADFHAAL